MLQQPAPTESTQPMHKHHSFATLQELTNLFGCARESFDKVEAAVTAVTNWQEDRVTRKRNEIISMREENDALREQVERLKAEQAAWLDSRDEVAELEATLASMAAQYEAERVRWQAEAGAGAGRRAKEKEAGSSASASEESEPESNRQKRGKQAQTSASRSGSPHVSGEQPKEEPAHKPGVASDGRSDSESSSRDDGKKGERRKHSKKKKTKSSRSASQRSARDKFDEKPTDASAAPRRSSSWSSTGSHKNEKHKENTQKHTSRSGSPQNFREIPADEPMQAPAVDQGRSSSSSSEAEKEKRSQKARRSASRSGSPRSAREKRDERLVEPDLADRRSSSRSSSPDGKKEEESEQLPQVRKEELSSRADRPRSSGDKPADRAEDVPEIDYGRSSSGSSRGSRKRSSSRKRSPSRHRSSSRKRREKRSDKHSGRRRSASGSSVASTPAKRQVFAAQTRSPLQRRKATTKPFSRSPSRRSRSRQSPIPRRPPEDYPPAGPARTIRSRSRGRRGARSNPPQQQGFCIPFAKGRCYEGLRCPDRHPDPEECRRGLDNLSKKPCRWGKECRRKDCIFRHPGEPRQGHRP